MSPPATPGIPERFMSDPDRSSIRDRLATVERQTAEIPLLVSEVGEIKKYLASVKALEGLVRGIVSKGVLLIVGAVGSTFGVTKLTATPPAMVTPAPLESASSVRLKAIQAMQPGSEKDRQLMQFIIETAPLGQR